MLFSLRNQIVILFTVLLLIPVSILTFVLTDKAEELVRHSIVTSTDQTITQYATYVNNLAKQFKDMSNQVLSSSITQDYVMAKDDPMLRANSGSSYPPFTRTTGTVSPFQSSMIAEAYGDWISLSAKAPGTMIS